MIDYTNLKKKIKIEYGTNKAFANKINASVEYVERVLDNKVDMTQEEIEEWANALNISMLDVARYFFVKKEG